jgi:hypothetical protein
MALTRGGLTEEDLALLEHPDLLAEEHPEAEEYEEQGDPVLAGFTERLLLGDLSW